MVSTITTRDKKLVTFRLLYHLLVNRELGTSTYVQEAQCADNSYFLPRKRYGHSKQASIIAAKAITDRYKAIGITAYSLHPGLIKSNLQSHDTSFLGMLSRTAMRIFPTLSPLDGARTSLYCATSPNAPSYAGRYFTPFGKVGTKENKWLDDAKCVDRLWTLATNQLRDHGFVIDDNSGK